MSSRSQLKRRLTQACAVASVTALIGATAWWFKLGEGLSYDLPFAFVGPVPPTNVVILFMDEPSHDALKEKYGAAWRRSQHARLLRHLKQDGSGPVIFDIFFPDPSDPGEDADFANAIAEHGQVILAADLSATAQPQTVGQTARPPDAAFRTNALAWGVAEITRETDAAVRRYPLEHELYPSLAWVAAAAIGGEELGDAEARAQERWIRYYGATAIDSLSYYSAFDRAPGYFKGKTVVVGGKPRTRYLGEEVEEFRSPYTLWQGSFISGVELQTIMLLNLLGQHWLIRLPWIAEFAAVILLSLLAGFGLRLLKPVPGGFVALALALVISAAGIFCALLIGVWFSWVTLAAIVVPAAWVCSLAAYKQEWRRPRSETYDEPAPFFPTPEGEQPEVHIPEYNLLKCIGRGAYGEVWLARNRVGIYHAIKIVFRKRLNEVTAYEREFRGIRKYMPVSLKHAGLVRILYVGRNDHAGYFFYIMELGDDENAGQEVNPETYTPRNFAKDLQKRNHLPVAECVAMGIALSEPLEFLHKRGLMHRDIKPSNIIFIDGIPKLADIGLVAEVSGSGGLDPSYVGTEGYMAPEGPSKPTCDIYSFGKVLYEASMGLDRREFPTLPDWMNQHADLAELMALNSLILKCCDANPKRRFQSAGELRRALLDVERHIAAKQTA